MREADARKLLSKHGVINDFGGSANLIAEEPHPFQRLSGGTPPVSEGTPPVSRGIPPVSKGIPPVSGGTPPVSQGTPPVSQGTPPVHSLSRSH